MKTLWAIIKLHEDETAQELLSTIFSKEEFNPQNAILIQKNMAIVEVFFEETPPRKIAEAIGGYSDVRCGFGEVSEECLKKAGMSLEQVYPAKVDGDIPHVDPTGGVDEEPPHDAGDGASGPEEDVLPADPTAGADEKPQNHKGNKGGKGAKRKAPDMIPQIHAIADTCTSYQQLAAKVIEWLGNQKRASYLKDVFEVAATVDKVSWTLIEEELRNRGYNNPFAVRNPTSVEVTRKLTELQIHCSFIALVEYVAKYKAYDFRSNIGKKVREILREMGIEEELLGLRQEITDVAIAAVMAEPEKVNMREICTAAGCGRDENDIMDARMNFSSFINEFLEKKGMEMMTAEEFIIKLREAIFTGSTIW